MATKYYLQKRSKFPFVVLESIGASIFSAYWLCKKYQWDWIIGFAIFLVVNITLLALFLNLRFFRYIFSFAFSLLWGFLGYALFSGPHSSNSAWAAFAVAFFIALSLHYGYFRNERDGNKILY